MACRCRYRTILKEESRFEWDSRRTTYLDYNATAPVDPRIMRAFEMACLETWGNPSSMHSGGVKAYEKIEAHRQTIGEYFSIPPDRISFSSSGSEAIHAALFGVILRNRKTRIFTTPVEHGAVLQPLHMARKLGHPIEEIPVDSSGSIQLDSFREGLKKNGKKFFIYSPVNHETGGVQPIEEIFSIAVNEECLILLDGVQAAARLSPERWVPYCDIATVSGHKLCTPKGIGFLYRKKGIRLRHTRFGGGQEGGFFPGTENVPGIAAFAKGVELLGSERQEEANLLTVLGEECLHYLSQRNIDHILQSPANRVPGVLNISFPWIRDMEKALLFLNDEGICVSRFSACSGRVDGSSSILRAMNRSRQEASTSLRISMGRWSKRADILHFIKAMETLQKQSKTI